jgi:hypothetical protein
MPESVNPEGNFDSNKDLSEKLQILPFSEVFTVDERVMGHTFPLDGLKGMAVQMHIDHLIRIVIEKVVNLVLGLNGKAAIREKMVVAVLPSGGSELDELDFHRKEIAPTKGHMLMKKIDLGLLGHKIRFMDLIPIDIDENVVTGIVDQP